MPAVIGRLIGVGERLRGGGESPTIAWRSSRIFKGLKGHGLSKAATYILSRTAKNRGISIGQGPSLFVKGACGSAAS